jgi:hypothetical protein
MSPNQLISIILPQFLVGGNFALNDTMLVLQLHPLSGDAPQRLFAVEIFEFVSVSASQHFAATGGADTDRVDLSFVSVSQAERGTSEGSDRGERCSAGRTVRNCSAPKEKGAAQRAAPF